MNADTPAMPVKMATSEIFHGLTKRETVAMHALQGLLAGKPLGVGDCPDVHIMVSFLVADRFLEQSECKN